jgi:hypothetical protein
MGKPFVSEYLSKYILLCSARLIDATSIMPCELEETGVEVCYRSAHCQRINNCEAHNLGTFIVLAATNRSAHGRAGETGGSAQAYRFNPDIDQCSAARTNLVVIVMSTITIVC